MSTLAHDFGTPEVQSRDWWLTYYAPIWGGREICAQAIARAWPRLPHEDWAQVVQRGSV